MSRTHRNSEKSSYKAYRRPRTFNEKSQIHSFIHDCDIPLRNHDISRSRNLPDVYDDIVKSGFYEDYRWKHHWD